MSESPRKLPLRRILTGAFVLPWRNRLSVTRAVGAPMLLLLAADLAWHTIGLRSNEASWFFWEVFAVSLAWLAVATHRLVLSHGWEPQHTFTDFSIKRLAWFLAALALIWLAVLVITMTLATIAANIVIGPRYVAAGESPPPDPPEVYFQSVTNLGMVIAYFVVGRISLVLPAIAIDRKPSVLEAWRWSRGNSWRLAIIVGALPWILKQATSLLWRDGATTFEIAALGILTGVFAIIGFVALSLSYYELTLESAPPPTHPPG